MQGSCADKRFHTESSCGKFRVFVDYAHTEDALRNVLQTLRDLKPRRLIAVFGCGGNRDRSKRPKMASVVEGLADWAIVTSDNPRKENPETIIDEVKAGFRRKACLGSGQWTPSGRCS